MVLLVEPPETVKSSARSTSSVLANDKKEQWKQSIRETVEKAIACKVEQRLDTPPLERMRRRQQEARLKKEQQLRVSPRTELNEQYFLFLHACGSLCKPETEFSIFSKLSFHWFKLCQE